MPPEMVRNLSNGINTEYFANCPGDINSGPHVLPITNWARAGDVIECKSHGQNIEVQYNRNWGRLNPGGNTSINLN